MDTRKLEKWANLLLDTGKRNNLINFRDTKASTVEVVLPDAEELFKKVESSTAFEVYDPQIDDDELLSEENPARLNRQEYMDTYAPRLKKAHQILLYNANVNSVNALKNIDKKARAYIEETGVNVAYMAFGFVHWKETVKSLQEFCAPILLAPITFRNDSAISPWYIRMTEEDVIVNPTFAFKLEAERGIHLPEYDDESLEEYLAKIVDIVGKLGWSVTREVKVGIFSFLKLNMYKDLMDHRDAILQNNNVRTLLGEPHDMQGISIEAGEHHLKNPLVELHNVVDADSSQIEAIEMAKAGVSFVLQGPPGTGKSQTITNIIAECIHDGKKVLFVSEKQAALNVVYDKLCKAGLEEFCLELHSYKSNKKDVIANLNKTLHAAKTAVSSRANLEIDGKVKSQKALDDYESELHQERDVIHRSLYQLYDAYASTRNTTDLKVSLPGISAKGDLYLREAMEMLSQYADFIPSIGQDYRTNPWYGYVNRDSSYELRETVRNCLAKLEPVLQQYGTLQAQILEKYGIRCDSLKDCEQWEKFFALAADSDILTPACLQQKQCSYLSVQLTLMRNAARDVMALRDGIDDAYDPEIYDIDALNAYKRLTREFTSGVGRLFNSEYKKLISTIRINKKDGKKPSYDDAIKLMERLNDYREKKLAFAQLEAPAREYLGASYAGVDSDWESILSDVEQMRELHEADMDFGGLKDFSAEEYRAARADFEKIVREMHALEEKSRSDVKLLSGCFDRKIFDIEKVDFAQAQSKLSGCLEAFDRLDNWCGFVGLLQNLEHAELIGYLNAALEAQVPKEDLVSTYERNFYRQWIDYIFHVSPVLAGFNRIAQESNVDIFRREDETQFAISKVQIRSEISAKRPSLDFIAPGSAVSTLLREGEKKRKQKSIRVLMEEVGELIQVIKPCFLMSPLSVSTFLNSDDIEFDVVVFDEASQIFPQDAIGAIYRGKQLIVVGDSKQMPPSNFFNTTVDSEDDDEETGDITDFESILDLCSTAFPQLRLRWHYRSRYEQLIAFSNKNFYDNDLVTFPSAVTDKPGVGVDYYYCPDGVFEHRSRNNRREAEFVVDLIYDNIEKYPNRSLGVVAFSMAQQDLIERLLSKRRVEDPSREEFFRKDAEEPFFIKNLETVQGDERDTIIFSVAYAKDNTGRLMHNFGPLNRVGGERRLNVAVTRAKMNVQLVASIHHTDIDLKRTGAEGAKLLKEYLDYAENGGIALERALTVDPMEQFDSEFELEVCEFLRKNGYQVDTQVGCSNFRIDLGLKRPDSSDYVLAIECDGATYHTSRNARDRDRLRQQILERMGWKFYRVWSTDWFKNNSVEKERLLGAVERALQPEKQEKASGVQMLHASGNEADAQQPERGLQQEENTGFEEVQEKHFSFPKYKMFDIDGLTEYPEDFQTLIAMILEVESPLSEEWLLKRISRLFGRERVTDAVRSSYENRMYGCEQKGIIRRDGFLYKKGQKKYMLRIPDQGQPRRDIKYISREEIAAGILVVVGQNVSVEKSGLYRFLANELGCQRVTELMQAKFEDALVFLNRCLDIDGTTITLKDPS